MDILTLLATAVGLAMDAFAVSLGNGTFLKKASPWQTVKIAGMFGLFQGAMPIIGYLVAGVFANRITAIDHWIAFGLLAFIGGKMVWEAAHEDTCEVPTEDPTNWKTLFLMAIATSIDAMAVGVTMAAMPTGLLAPWYGFLLCSAVIAVVTFACCTVGVQLGCKTGSCWGNRAEIGGGIVLILIGVKILIEHLFFS